MACSDADGPHNMLQIIKDGCSLTIQDCTNAQCQPTIERFLVSATAHGSRDLWFKGLIAVLGTASMMWFTGGRQVIQSLIQQCRA